MTYTATELEKTFKKTARIRTGKEYEKDADYWDGGHCNWGGSHSLKEDCQTFANGFNKIESLRDIKEELKSCTSKSEYDAKKNNYIRKCDEGINGLQNKSASSSMFGVCCIWSDKDTNKEVESKIKLVREDLEDIKKTLNKESYKWVQELKELELEISQITQRMEENKRKTMSETDPIKKVALIQAIEEDGSLLQKKYEKKKELSNKFNFDPKKKVDDLINSLKKSIEKGGKGKDSSSSGGRKNNPDPSDPDNSESDDDNTNNNNSNNSNKKDENQSQPSFFQENKLFIFAGIGLLAFVYLHSNQNEYDD